MSDFDVSSFKEATLKVLTSSGFVFSFIGLSLLSRAVLRLAVAGLPRLFFTGKNDYVLWTEPTILRTVREIVHLTVAIALNRSLYHD